MLERTKRPSPKVTFEKFRLNKNTRLRFCEAREGFGQ